MRTMMKFSNGYKSIHSLLDKIDKDMTEKEAFKKIYNASIRDMFHNIMDHGMGFCSVCGELRKRCWCGEFTPLPGCPGKDCPILKSWGKGP